MTPQLSGNDVHGQRKQPADPVCSGSMNTICSNPVPPTPVNNGATITHAPINTSDTPPEHHSTTQGTPQAAIYHAPPLQRPEFHHRMSQASWRTTVANWRIYCQALRIPPSEVATQLYLCCDQQLQRTLLTKCPQITASSGDSILGMIHEITCRDTNLAVFHRQFGNMIQQVGEDIQNFATGTNGAGLPILCHNELGNRLGGSESV